MVVVEHLLSKLIVLTLKKGRLEKKIRPLVFLLSDYLDFLSVIIWCFMFHRFNIFY